MEKMKVTSKVENLTRNFRQNIKILAVGSVAVVTIAAVTTGCSSTSEVPTAEQKKASPVHLGTENLSYDATMMVNKAMVDYNLVSTGRLPKFAKSKDKEDEKAAARVTGKSPQQITENLTDSVGKSFTDNSGSETCTVDYFGAGYTLRIFCSPANIGDVAGFYYGPMLRFTKYSSAHSSAAAISNIQFYTASEIRKIRAK